MKYLRFSMSASAIALSMRPDVGPCSASAATSSEMSSIETSRPQGVLLEPAQARVGRGPAVDVLRQPGDGPVVDDLAVLVAPRRVDDRADRDLAQVPRHDPVDEARRVLARDPVLEERRDVDQRRGVADRVVLVLVVGLVGGDRVVARPLAIVQALAERERPLVYGGSDRHWIVTSSSGPTRHSLSGRAIISMLARSRQARAARTTGHKFDARRQANEREVRRRRHRWRPQRPRSTPPTSRARARRSSSSSAATSSGGAAVTEEVFPGFKFSVCSYVVSLLRPEIIRDLDLPAPRPRDPPARRHLHADAERRLPLARQRPRQDAPRDRAPLEGRRGGLRRVRQGDGRHGPLRQADPRA